jgi:hypothetical protein
MKINQRNSESSGENATNNSANLTVTAESLRAPTNTTISSLTHASREQAPLKRIADLEALLTAAENKTSNHSQGSATTNFSRHPHPNSSDSFAQSDADTTESRLTVLEAAIYDIKKMLTISIAKSKSSPQSVQTISTADISYSTVSHSDSPAHPPPSETSVILSIGSPLKAQSVGAKHRKPLSTAPLSVLASELQLRQQTPSTAEYSTLTILPQRVSATISSPPATPIGKKQRRQKSPEPIITAIMSQYKNQDYSSETAT